MLRRRPPWKHIQLKCNQKQRSISEPHPGFKDIFGFFMPLINIVCPKLKPVFWYNFLCHYTSPFCLISQPHSLGAYVYFFLISLQNPWTWPGIKIWLSNSLSKTLLHWSPRLDSRLLSKYFPSFHREHTNMFPARPTFPSVHQTLPGNLQRPTPKWSPCVLPSSHPTKLLWPVIPGNSETHYCIMSIMCLQFHLLGNSTSEPNSSPSQVPCLQRVSLELSQRSTLAL